MKKARCLGLAAFLTIFVVWLNVASAWDCPAHETNQTKPALEFLTEPIEVRISYEAEFPTLDRNELSYAVNLATTAYNEQGRTAYFRSHSSGAGSPLSPLDDYYDSADCSNVVVVRFVGGSSLPGSEIGKCVDLGSTPAVMHGSEIKIAAFDENEQPYDWFVDPTTATSEARDLVGVLVHELGHSVGLYHPVDRAQEAHATVMSPGSPYRRDGHTTHRDLYEQDLFCLQDLIDDNRDLDGTARYFDRASEAFTSTADDLTSDYFSTASGPPYGALSRSYDGSSWSNYLLFSSDLLEPYFYGTVYVQTPFPGIATTLDAGWPSPVAMRYADFEESASYKSGIFYSSGLEDVADPNQWSTSAKFPLYNFTKLASEEWGDAPETAGLTHCLDMSGWMECEGRKPIFTADPFTVEWLPRNEGPDDAIFAWVNHDRSENGNSTDSRNRVFVAVNRVDEATLATPDELPINSTVSPGLACSVEESAAEFECILAYVDVKDSTGNVRIAQFDVASNPHRRYVSSFSSHHLLDVNVRTASPLYAWYSGGSFYVALRPTRRLFDQGIEVFGSEDAVDWELLTREIGYSALGPMGPPGRLGGQQPIGLFE